MKQTKLNQVRFRLGIRYFHLCHGDVETAVMFVDRRLIRRTNEDNVDNVSFPLVHDIWTANRTSTVPPCDACYIRVAMYVTSTECKTTDGGPRPLCGDCCKELRLLEKEADSVRLYPTWRNQADLSNNIAREYALYF